MTIHFYLRYHTTFGQSVFVSGDTGPLGNNIPSAAFALSYLDTDFWHGTIEIPVKKNTGPVNYRYIIRENGNADIIDGEKDRKFDPASIQANEIILFDTWHPEGDVLNIFFTKPFQQVLLNREHTSPKLKEAKFFTHEFRIKAPLLKNDEWVCITGSGKLFEEWDVKKLLPLKKEGSWYTLRLNLGKEDFPVSYKYGIYNTSGKSFEFETGNNRVLQSPPFKKQHFILHDGFIRAEANWKGAGIAIPVFSLRSKTGLGTGEFNDIKLLADWSAKAGIKLIQLLPVNDTCATFTNKDSYPYAAISAFALHPLYINLETVAGTQNSSLLKSLQKKKDALNQLPGLDYKEVINYKLSVLRDIYKTRKHFVKDKKFIDFFKDNREWLLPYAVYCYLRDKHKTADFTSWKSNAVFNEKAVQKLASPSQPHYSEICFYYFVQYHLHLQLQEASRYAHKKGIVLKGDIAIGVSRNSCDVWVDPSLYNATEQTGAPPDPFTIKGQNWGFPTYNWEKMQADNFAWWKKRFAQMNTYFDGFRIDHILGFFRIWSIPLQQVEGIMGRFIPAIPVDMVEFDQHRIAFDRERYCKPYITDEILNDIGSKATEIKSKFLDRSVNGRYQLKKEFDTQAKIENYFKQFPPPDLLLKENLFDLVSNVIVFEESSGESGNTGNDKFHFRISMHNTSSFKALDYFTQKQLSHLYDNYFYTNQDMLWKKSALQKLPALKRTTDMLIFGEDLGMVPNCLPEVMKITGILSLEVQRMPRAATDFSHPRNAPYLSVVTPSTHDMSTIREWWEEDKALTQKFYNYILGHYGKAPETCGVAMVKDIILQHIYSPAMWCIFQLQDLLGMSNKLRRPDQYEERINQPADPNHYWKYRMHLTLEDLIKEKEFTNDLKTLLQSSNRA